MAQLGIVNINPFLAAHSGMHPKGRVLFVGAANAREIVDLAGKGHAVTVFESDPLLLARARNQAVTAGAKVQWVFQRDRQWRLGFEQWDGIVALFPRWTLAESRQFLRAVPCALKPGGSFLCEAYSAGPEGPGSLSDAEHDLEDVRASIDVLHLSRFATVPCSMRQQAVGGRPAWVLQIVGSHLEADEDVQTLPLKAVRRRAV